MFGRTFSISTRGFDPANPVEVVRSIEERLLKELPGHPAYPFLFFADANVEFKKVVFYDMCTLETTMEFASIFGRFPQYSISFDGEKSVKIHHFHEDGSVARVLSTAIESRGGRRVIASAALNEAESAEETQSVRQVTSVVTGLLDAAQSLDGKVA